MNLIFHMMWMATLTRAACVPISTEKILVNDLTEAAPAFKDLNPEIVIGFAPLPGTRRIIRGQELSRIARQNGVAATNLPDVCVERLLRTISPAEMQAALLAALGVPDARLELIAFSNQALPPGRLEFHRFALSEPPLGAPEAPVIWRGKLVYDGRHSMAVWAKVRITVERPVFVASEDIPGGTVIQDRQVKTINSRQFPFSGSALTSCEEIIGRVARRNLQAGQKFAAGLLEEAKEIVKGDIIQVRVIDGAATLSLDAIAEGSGKVGETILVHNSASGRNFRAMVEGKGKAVVRPASGD